MSEKTLGAWMKARGNRQQVVVATKGAHPNLETMHIPRLSPAEIVGDLEASLGHLQTEQIDLYWLHRDDPARPVSEILETLEAQRQAGKIRYYGCSNWRPARLREAQSYAQQHGLSGFAADQPLWNLAQVEYANLGDPTLAVMDGELWALHRELNLACVPFSSQANGFFQKLERGQEARIQGNQRRMYLTPENRARFERAQALKARSGLSTTQIVLGYLLAQPFPTFPVIGPKTQEQLRDSLSAAEAQLSAEDVAFLTGE